MNGFSNSRALQYQFTYCITVHLKQVGFQCEPLTAVRTLVVERSLFSLWLSCTFNHLQVADGCVSPSNYAQVKPTVGCGSGPSFGGQ